MKYIFDFDRVLYDTDALKRDMIERGVYVKGETKRSPELLDAAEAAGLDLRSYVNQTALDFIKQHQGECAIVSSAFSRNDGQNFDDEATELKFQLEKIKRSGLQDGGVIEKVVVTGEDKSLALAEWQGQEAVLFDDEPVHLRAARELGFTTVLLRTETERGVESMPVPIEGLHEVRSFAEFCELEKQWQEPTT